MKCKKSRDAALFCNLKNYFADMFSLERIFLKITRSSLEKYKIKKETIMERF